MACVQPSKLLCYFVMYISCFRPSNPGKERHFRVKVKDPEFNNLTTTHMQYTVYHQLSNVGKVLQLEHQLFWMEWRPPVLPAGTTT